MKKVKFKKFAGFVSVILAFCLIISMYPAPAAAAADHSTVRVKLSIGSKTTSNVTSISFNVAGTYTIKEKPMTVLSNKTYTVSISGANVRLSDGAAELYTGPSFTLLQCNNLNNTISLYNNYYSTTFNYLGNMQFDSSLKVADGKTSRYLRAINIVYIEQYLYGVVPYEMSDTWPMEALKAQAVCARGYAVQSIEPDKEYDLVDNAGDQVYKGYNASNKNTVQAVNATAKKVLTYKGEIITTYFSASNGGYTESVSNLWSHNKPQPYWVVKADPYDLRNKNTPRQTLFLPTDAAAYYKAHIAEEDNPTIRSLNLIKSNYIEPLVKADGYAKDGVLYNFSIIKINSITGVVNSWHKNYAGYLCNHIESMNMAMTVRIINPDTLAAVDKEYTVNVPFEDTSTNPKPNFENWGIFKTSLSAYWLSAGKDSNGAAGYTILHARFGHGAGMSQRGAQQMSNEGWGYARILNFYFPNTTLSALSSINAPAPAAAVKPAIAAIGLVKNSLLTVYGAANTAGTKLGTLSKNKVLQIVKKDASSGWHQIWYNNQLAYVQKAYVTLVSGTKQYVKSATAVVYKSASKTSGTLLTLQRGKSLYVYTSSGDFYLTLSGGKTGYILKSALSLKPVKPNVAAIAKVKVSKATLRSGAAASKSKVATLAKGKMVDVIVIDYSKDWAQVWYNNKPAYVLKSEVSISAGKQSAIKAKTATLFTSASSSSKKLGTLKKGAKINIYSYSGKYAYINYKGITGYIYKSAL